MKDVRYDGTAHRATILRENGESYEWEGPGEVVSVTNDEADELVKDPRFNLVEDDEAEQPYDDSGDTDFGDDEFEETAE